MVKQTINIRLFNLEQIPHPGANLQKAMANKCPGGGGVLGNHGIDWGITATCFVSESNFVVIQWAQKTAAAKLSFEGFVHVYVFEINQVRWKL
jgi:hypothetical protein